MVALGRDEHGLSLSIVHKAWCAWQGAWAKLFLRMFQEEGKITVRSIRSAGMENIGGIK